MARNVVVLIAFSLTAASPFSAASADPVLPQPAPADSPGARYCMRVGPLTGNLAETVQCWTRAEWAEQGVDVDKDWSKEGVAVLR